MQTNAAPPNYKGYRFPPEIISHSVWLSFRFSLRYRDVEELMAQRGIVLTYETIRQGCLKFGQPDTHERRRRRPCCGDKWHLDEMVLTIGSQKPFLWRAAMTIPLFLLTDLEWHTRNGPIALCFHSVYGRGVFFLYCARRGISMKTDNDLENRQVKGLAELEAREDLRGVDASYCVTVQLTVNIWLKALAPRYAVEDAITALHEVIPQAVELPQPDIVSVDLAESYAEGIE